MDRQQANIGDGQQYPRVIAYSDISKLLLRWGLPPCNCSTTSGEHDEMGIAKSHLRLSSELAGLIHIFIMHFRDQACLLLYTDIHRAIHLFTIWAD